MLKFALFNALFFIESFKLTKVYSETLNFIQKLNNKLSFFLNDCWKSVLWAYNLGLRPVATINSLLVI
jgi:hypothetical protein